MIQDSLTHSDTISFAQAKHLLDTEPDCLLFDVREEEEFITGHPVEAELFTLDTIDAQTAELRIPSKDTPVLVYCRSGNRSKQASEKLVKLGYTNIVEFGGINDWTGETVSGEA